MLIFQDTSQQCVSDSADVTPSEAPVQTYHHPEQCGGPGEPDVPVITTPSDNSTSTTTASTTESTDTTPMTTTNSTDTTTATTTASTTTSTDSTTTAPTTPTTTAGTTTPGAPVTTPHPKPDSRGHFDGWSFFGGILLTLGIAAIGFVGFKYYKIRSTTGGNYNRF